MDANPKVFCFGPKFLDVGRFHLKKAHTHPPVTIRVEMNNLPQACRSSLLAGPAISEADRPSIVETGTAVNHLLMNKIPANAEILGWQIYNT